MPSLKTQLFFLTAAWWWAKDVPNFPTTYVVWANEQLTSRFELLSEMESICVDPSVWIYSFNDGEFLQYQMILHPPPKANITMENPPIEDGFPIENVVFSMFFSDVIVSIHGFYFLNLCPEKMLFKIWHGGFESCWTFCPKVEPISTCCKQNPGFRCEQWKKPGWLGYVGDYPIILPQNHLWFKYLLKKNIQMVNFNGSTFQLYP